MMYHIPDVLSTDQVAEFTRQLAQAEWVDGRVTVGSQGAAVKQNQQIDTRTPLYARLQAAVLDMLRGHPQFFSAALPRTISAPLFNRYGPGETYGFHVNGAVRQNGEAGWMRTDLSATLFLCEPESYEGKTVRMQGELVSYPHPFTGEDCHAVIVKDALACCAQGFQFQPAEGVTLPEDGAEVTVTGIYTLDESLMDQGIMMSYLAECAVE